MEKEKKLICPVCGCTIGDSAYVKDGVTYCCEPCAENKECQCGCCTGKKVEHK